MNADIKISDFMDTQPAFVAADASIIEAVDILLKKGISGAPVVNEHKHVIGFISEKDCIKKLLLSSYHCDAPATVGEVMHKATVTVDPEASIVDLANYMDDHRPKVYPVVDDGKLVGVISRTHVLMALKQKQLQCSQHS
ncbi:MULTISPECIES: CBS domain-containing protein [unclassified Hahella]|uniref:CBS domain-containing protein n=1 Tax=unclassified Hahella TaxID=2624107 RepID=UPI000FDDDA1A|nr:MULTISPECIES: CBS domain-containing protein [unclassified Hahella]AZZ89777.1 CBS domain-containing protein [Hahella sp. KA22]MBU6950316.1 CBS domain-containing protein [Hahella sp. HN01]MDG9666350.1 CBS domain-containing protein [Hahella sp. CR1]QAY53147.1 CBS domain-containing protein [Hahella sp. KA22]